MKKINLIIALFFIAFITNAQNEVKINDNFVVEADGTLRYDNAATVWDDLMVYPDAAGKVAGTKSPVWTLFKNNGSGSQGAFLWMFDKDQEQEVYFTIQIPHSYKASSDIYPHVHWTTITGTPTANNVVWGLEYTVVAIGGTYSNTTIINTTSVISEIGSPSGTTQHLISSFPAISGSNLGISTVLVCRLFRNTGHTNDTFNNSVGLLGFDLHYQKDTDGSRTEFAK